jgi:oligopeptidase B
MPSARTSRPLPKPPAAGRRPSSFELHGVTVTDEFAWLKADNWQDVLKDPALLQDAIRAYLDAENSYASRVMAGTANLQKLLVKEMRGRIKEDESSVPAPDGDFAYYVRYRDGGEHPLYCRKPRRGGAETLLIDGDALGKGKAFFDLGDVVHSPDHRLIAWSADDKGSEFYVIHVRDTAKGDDLAETVPESTGDVVWTNNARAFYYVRRDEKNRPSKVYRHRIGSAAADDRLIFEEANPGWFVDVDKTQSGAFGVISVADHETSEAWLIDLADEEATPRLVAARQTEIRYEVEHHGERLIILTNADGAEDFKLVEAPLADPARGNWRDLVAHRPGVMILSHTPFARHLVRLEREDARPRIVVRDWAGGAEHAIAFAEEAYALGFSGGYEFDTDTVRFLYSSMTTPTETFDYDMATRQRRLLKRQEVPSGHDPAQYVTRRLFAPAADGERIPVSILHRRATPLDGTAPLLLYGYGAYGSAMSAAFRTNPLSLVDRGFVYAIAHVRGGTEKGWRWYVDGKRDKKINTFTDFIAVGRYLAEAGYTSVGRIVGHGGSAGGLLMGAVANMAPELFAAILAEVPFVDVLNTMLDGDLPLTPPEWPEWGNPRIDAAAFATILSYSPYECVGPHPYPPILALGGLTDPRVTYWEPAKWVARLRATMSGGGPIALRTNMDAGHGGASGRFDRLKEVALVYAFALRAIAGFGRPGG